MKWYLSGPCSGYPGSNRRQFEIAADMLRERGYRIINPLEDEEPGKTWAEYLRADIRALMDCRGVVVLPGWQESRGASLEVHIAHQLGMQVLPFAVAASMRGDA